MFSLNKSSALTIFLLLASPALAQHNHHAMEMGEVKQTAHEHGAMPGALGSYPMSREASGTSWVPDSSPMEGIHGSAGAWNTMVHGYIDAVYSDQGGPRGDEQAYSQSMFMAMGNRKLGEGTFGLRAMGSLDVLMGKRGYPLLLQTGETADGIDHLIDRQHPHDLFMELAASYSHPLGDDRSAFFYLGYPGEPALGPPTFMHRTSGIVNPAAPITHHWLDSTHITFGVATAGYIAGDWKLEGSLFNGREPDQFRYNFDDMNFNSESLRLSYNPSENWALQISHGWLRSPEQLEPGVDQQRTTFSAIYNLPLDDERNIQTTFAWGRNELNPGPTLDAFLLESAYRFAPRHTVFGRAEYAEKDELFEAPDPLAGQVFEVGQLSLGYLYDMPAAEHVKWGVGAVGTAYALPDAIEPRYGDTPLSFMLFTRLSLD